MAWYIVVYTVALLEKVRQIDIIIHDRLHYTAAAASAPPKIQTEIMLSFFCNSCL
jgi:hypothetical protein